MRTSSPNIHMSRNDLADDGDGPYFRTILALQLPVAVVVVMDENRFVRETPPPPPPRLFLVTWFACKRGLQQQRYLVAGSVDVH